MLILPKFSMLLLSRFSCVQLCATPETAAHQALPSLGFSRQEHWSGLPFPSPMHAYSPDYCTQQGSHSNMTATAKSLQSCPTLCVPTDGSPPGSPVPGILPGKNAGVGCHFLLQCMKVKSESKVAQSCPTLRDPMDCSLPGSSVHGIFQARILEWVAIAFSKFSIGTPESQKWNPGIPGSKH